MKSIVVVGAGREGKGFLGEVFSTAGWNVAFLDKDPEVIKALTDRGSYTARLFTVDGVITRDVSGYEAYECDQEHSVLDAVIGSDLIALCVYPEDIDDVAEYLAPCFERRADDNPGSPLTIIACTNKNHILPEILASFRNKLTNATASWFDSAVEVRDTIVRRSVGAASHRSLELEAQVFLSLLIQSPITVDLSEVPWMEEIDDLELLKEVKLYTYNAPHAACAYAGYLAGYQTIAEAMADPLIAERSAGVLDEAIRGVSREFKMDADELRVFSTLPSLPEDIVDYIARVAYDPIRKLAGDERLVGVARFCLNHGIQPTSAIESIVDALNYDEAADPRAVDLQRLIAERGVADALSEVSGLPLDNPLIGLVVDAYERRRALDTQSVRVVSDLAAAPVTTRNEE